jgi:TonB-linked SusC/RagA family outer membrane protein
MKKKHAVHNCLRPCVIMFFTFLFLSIAQQSWATDGKKAVIGFKRTPLPEVLEKVEKVFEVQFTYDPAALKSPDRLDLPKKERSLDEVLDLLSRQFSLKFLMVGDLIGVQKTTPSETNIPVVKAEDITIKGTVKDKNDQPMPGATVKVKGGTKTVITNNDGSFTITVPKGSILEISSVGYDSQEIKVQTDGNIGIVLQPGERSLGEVVITSLGIRKEKVKVAYAMQEVKGEALQKAPESNIASNLVGKVAGLSIYTKSSLFDNPEIYLRGEITLVVIDGVPTDKASFDFWSLNANDIESVNVLKGTSAAALYGSLGINGAIMITTKKGKGGANGTEVTYNTTTQFQAGFLRIPNTQKEYGMGWDGYYAFINGKGGGGWYDDYGYVWGPKLNVKNPANASGFEEYPQYNSPYDPNTLYPFTQNGYTDYSNYKPLPWVSRGQNNLKNFLNNEISTTHNVSISGKTDRSDYRISISHLYQKGQVPNTKLNSTTLSVAGSLKITDKLKAEASASYNRQYTPNYPYTGYGPNSYFYNILLWMGPDVDLRDLRDYWKPGGGRSDGGNFIPYGVKNIQQYNYNYTWYNNPWYLANEYLRGYTNDVVVSQVNATYDFNKDLSLQARTGINYNNAFSDFKTPYSFINYTAAPYGNYDVTQKTNFQIVSDVLLTYKKTFLKNFNATVSAGASNLYTQSKRFDGSTQGGLNVPAFYNLSNSINTQISLNKLAERQVTSAYGYADLGYKNMVYLNFTARNDWTTTLQKPNNSFFYPSASISIIGSEILHLPPFISYFKLRGSWANISSDNVVPYGDPYDIYTNYYGTLPIYTQGSVNTTNIRWNGTSALNLPGTLITPGLRPNTTISQEYGTEIRFMKNRIGFDFTWFKYLDKNIIKQVPISGASGFSYELLNADEISRRGIEVVLSGTPVKSKNTRWDVTFNYSRLRKIARAYYGGDQIRDGVKIGERTDNYRTWGWERSPDGQIVYDGNGIPKYIDHIVNLGTYDPDWEFGFINKFSYKNFTISFSFDGRIGGLIYDGVEQKLYEGGMHPATANKYRDDSYAGNATYVGQGVVVTGGDVQYDIQGHIISDTRKFAPNTTAIKYIDWVFDTYVNGIPESDLYDRTFVKLREVSLTYNVAPKMLGKTPFKEVSISITGRNLALWSKVPFMDPDGYNGGGLPEPSYRNIGVNLNLKF